MARQISVVTHVKTFGLRSLVFFIRSRIGRLGKVVRLESPKYSAPIFLRCGTTDSGAFKQVILNREYDIDLGFIPSTIVDCGANVGLATVFFKNKYPDARIVSVEPESSNYEMLLLNIAGYDHVHTLKAGIWWRNARLVITNKGAETGNWGFMVAELAPGAAADQQRDAIDAVCIPEIMRRFDMPQIDLLKMDIEGSEKELFADGWQQWLPHVRALVIELHDPMKPGCSDALFEALRGYEYAITQSGENLVIRFK
ncbi:MAG: FkbM family methyltransferase [Rikenellaceae bacterium]|jgi:FkbM family methyltransferase|nr:FkbM family methyltransferase [Rikenellaceae bacterium]